jgi:O-antigen/teichoic acid export membrane protein
MTEPEKKDHLVKDSLILFIASSVVNVSNFAFHMYATRSLKPEDYGVLATLLAMVMIFTMPSASLQMTIVNKAAALKAKEKYGSIEHLFKGATLWFLVVAVIAFGILVLASKIIGDFFRITDGKLMLILGGIIVISFVLPVVRGVLQGMQKFINLGINQIIDALFRLAFLVIFVTLGFGVRGALATTLFSASIAYIAGVFAIRSIFKYKDEEVEIIKKREIFGYAIPVLVAFLGFSLLSYMDLFMVKHFFTEEEAGFYAVTSIIGKAFLFFPSAIIMALFPKVAEHTVLKKNPAPMLIKSMALTAGVSFAGIIFCFIFPEFVLRLLTGGEKYFAITGVVRIFGAAILPLVLFNVILNYSLASRKYTFIYFLYGGMVFYAGFLWFFHANFSNVLAVMFGVNMAMLILSFITLIYDSKKAEAK